MKLRILSESIKDLQNHLKEKYDLEDLWIIEGPKHIEISSIRVKPENQGKGIGSKVLDEIKKYASDVNKRIILFAEAGRGKKTALNRFYKQNEFKKPGRSKDYSIPQHTHIWNPK